MPIIRQESPFEMQVLFDLVHIAYNASKLAVDRLTQLQLSATA